MDIYSNIVYVFNSIEYISIKTMVLLGGDYNFT